MDKILDKIGNAVGFVVVMIVLVLMAKNGLGRIFNNSNQEDDAASMVIVDQVPVDVVGVYEGPVFQEPVELAYENIGIQEFIAMVRDGQGVEEENPARWELEYKDKYKGKPIAWRGKVDSISTDQCLVVAAVENPDFQARVDERAEILFNHHYDNAYNTAYQECVDVGLDMITCSMSAFLTLEELASLNVGDEVLVQGNLEVYGARDYNTSLYGPVESSSYFGSIQQCRLLENYGQ